MKSDNLILIALDYDRSAKVIIELLSKVPEQLAKLRFIPLESFEEVICNSEFILSKFPEMRELVVNYTRYINCNIESTGKYFSKLLYMYVKERSPVKEESSSKNKKVRNSTKFYEKGMPNFKQCFIDDCCSYNRDQDSCKLYYDSDKKRVLLNNKFEQYQKLIK